MSAKTLTECCFELAAKQTVSSDHRTPEANATEIQFREELRREYRLEAINAGLNMSQAIEYARALSPETELALGTPGMALVGRKWFYHSGARVVWRTVISGLIELTRRGKGKITGRTAAASKFAFGFRPWNAGGRG